MSDEPRDELDEAGEDDLESEGGEEAVEQPAETPEKPTGDAPAAQRAALSPKPVVKPAATPPKRGRGGLALVIIILCVVAVLVVAALYQQQRTKWEAEQKRQERRASLATMLGAVPTTIQEAEALAAEGKLAEAKAKLNVAGENVSTVASLAIDQGEMETANRLDLVKRKILDAEKAFDQAQADYEQAVQAAEQARNKAAADAMGGIEESLRTEMAHLSGTTDQPLTSPKGQEPAPAGGEEAAPSSTTPGEATGTTTEPSAGTGAAQPSTGTETSQPSAETETTQPSTGAETTQPSTDAAAQPATGAGTATGEQPAAAQTAGTPTAQPAPDTAASPTNR